MDDFIKSILLSAKNIVIIGASTNSEKDSFKVMSFLQNKSFKVFPVNSKRLNEKVLGEKIYQDIKEIENDIDIIVVFRPSSEIYNLVNKFINKKAKIIWLQLGIFCTMSEKKLDKLDINFIQNKCIKIEYEKLFND